MSIKKYKLDLVREVKKGDRRFVQIQFLTSNEKKWVRQNKLHDLNNGDEIQESYKDEIAVSILDI